ncbi:DNA-binding GntR family transcriptional regulator [Nocardiopsis mwathae]|uniref:DNA-binding GntR family transcriptional regulator n=1 Tax=Nocardiopsis mwathae TaxID=1472723 RepID=A0A7X0D6W3_9ACTN|nr:winged helix-turn-helix domain-containing protein [Nocardiopsis mwathae]MBB6173690.1 DNA-binding GntR family transcriptional regulator [Nocardiopsis mwathae]
MAIDLDGPEFLRDQVAAILRGRISSGEYPPRRRIPPELELMDEFKVSRPTVRAALSILEAEGLIVTLRGKGRYVTGHLPPDANE